MNEIIKGLRQQFFTYRNGILADYLRKAGYPYKIIFGLNLQQISTIAQSVDKNKELAEALWQDSTSREGRLIAPFLMPQNEFSLAEATEWAYSIKCEEEADVLCHRLLRHMNYAWQLAEVMIKSSVLMERYVALRLMFNLLPGNMDEIKHYAEEEKAKEEPLTMLLCHQLLDEIAFICEDSIENDG